MITSLTASNLPHAALAGTSDPPLACTPPRRDEAQRAERAGDLQRLVTMDAAAQALAARRQVVGW